MPRCKACPGLRSGVIAALFLVTLVCGPTQAVQNTHGPGGVDVEMQQRDGDVLGSFVTGTGCIHGTSPGNTVLIDSCDAYILDLSVDNPLKYVRETQGRNLTLNAGDGTYWVAMRWDVGTAVGGWTCAAGSPYCWMLSPTRPPTPPGTLIIMSSTVGGGAITLPVSEAPRRFTTPATFATPFNTGPYAVWSWDASAPVTATGGTIFLGACPRAGRFPIFSAGIDVLPWACEYLYPEWWGADPTGATDATTAWRTVLNVARNETPVSCLGTYAITANQVTAIDASDAGNNALTLVGYQQIIGKVTQTNVAGSNIVQPCRFEFTGTGNAIGTVHGTGHNNILLKNVYIWDKGGQGNRALDLWQFAGSALDTVVMNGFHTGLWLGSNFYYGSIEKVGIANARNYCADLSGAATNGAFIEIECDSHVATLQTGILVGAHSPYYGTGHINTFRFLIETSYGTPLNFQRQRAFSLDAYIEQYGSAENHDTAASARFAYLEGGRVHIKTTNSTDVDPGAIPVAMRFFNASGDPANNKNLTVTGFVGSRYTFPLVVDGDMGIYGIDASGLNASGDPLQQWGPHTGGIKLSNNLMTFGGPPGTTSGRSSPTTVWRAGDIIWGSTGAGGPMQNVIRIVNTDGNPPATSAFMLDSLGSVAMGASATPSVKVNQLWATRFTLEDGGAAITNFLDGTAGQCIWLRALGARTIKYGASTIKLNPASDFVMSADDTLMLCLEANVWREYTRSNHP